MDDRITPPKQQPEAERDEVVERLAAYLGGEHLFNQRDAMVDPNVALRRKLNREFTSQFVNTDRLTYLPISQHKLHGFEMHDNRFEVYFSNVMSHLNQIVDVIAQRYAFHLTHVKPYRSTQEELLPPNLQKFEDLLVHVRGSTEYQTPIRSAVPFLLRYEGMWCSRDYLMPLVNPNEPDKLDDISLRSELESSIGILLEAYDRLGVQIINDVYGAAKGLRVKEIYPIADRARDRIFDAIFELYTTVNSWLGVIENSHELTNTSEYTAYCYNPKADRKLHEQLAELIATAPKPTAPKPINKATIMKGGVVVDSYTPQHVANLFSLGAECITFNKKTRDGNNKILGAILYFSPENLPENALRLAKRLKFIGPENTMVYTDLMIVHPSVQGTEAHAQLLNAQLLRCQKYNIQNAIGEIHRYNIKSFAAMLRANTAILAHHNRKDTTNQQEWAAVAYPIAPKQRNEASNFFVPLQRDFSLFGYLLDEWIIS